ncbi:MAG: M3 family metallopeptidase, partial [Luteimonas sp.]
MKHPLPLALAIAITGASIAPALAQTADTTRPAMIASASPFAADSPLPLHYPQFDRIADADFAPAFDAGMAEDRKEAEAVANDPDKPTFDNTIVALERSGQLLDRATMVFFNLVGTDTNPTRETLRADYAPKFSAHNDAIRLNPKLFARIKALYDQRATLGLDAESARLIERYYTSFVRSGANLNDADKTRLKTINSELAKLGTQFSQNVLKEVNDSAVVVDNKAELDGFSDEQIAGAAAAAKERKLDGKYVITLLNTTGQPPESQLTNRGIRERLHKASVARNSRGNAFDNTAIVSQVLKLRAERAKMLGYPTYAAYVLDDETAKTPQTVNDMLGKLAPPAVANARKEAADLQAAIDREHEAKGERSFTLEPWDWAFYSEKVRQQKFDFDESQLKPYLEMKNVLENGVFFAANKFYGIGFKERTDLPKYRADIWTYDVTDSDGTPLAIFIFDPYARASKRGGAWMNSYVNQSGLMGTKPVVANQLNIPKPGEGKPTLLTWSEVTTTFHEFGHALHGMFS